MTPHASREPSRDELLAMAYVDGELAPEARAEVEARMATESALAGEVAQLQKLAVLARQVAPREPKDYEWDRLNKELVHSTGLSLGWILTIVGVFGLALVGIVGVLRAEIHPIVKLCSCVALGGLLLLFLFTLRGRLRTLPYDPYTEVER